jgi:hypothetical protein
MRAADALLAIAVAAAGAHLLASMQWTGPALLFGVLALLAPLPAWLGWQRPLAPTPGLAFISFVSGGLLGYLGLADWAPARAVDALQKLCHDLMARAAGAPPRFFEPADLPPAGSLAALGEWSRELLRTARTAEHPFNTGLMLEALVSRARRALHSRSERSS